MIDLLGEPLAIRHLPIERGAEFSPFGHYRYTLTRRWGDGPTALWIGTNPSVADTERDDPTILRETHFSRSWGYGGFVKVNLYPIVTPDMATCRIWAAGAAPGCTDEVSAELARNATVIVREAKTAAIVMAAWGAIAWDDDWVRCIVRAINRPLYCLGTTANGAPIHPMARGVHRVPNDQQPVLWSPR